MKKQSARTLHGEVTQMIEENGKCTLKVSIRPFFLTLDDHTEYHLGDKVHIRTQIDVLDVEQEFVAK